MTQYSNKSGFPLVIGKRTVPVGGVVELSPEQLKEGNVINAWVEAGALVKYTPPTVDKAINSGGKVPGVGDAPKGGGNG